MSQYKIAVIVVWFGKLPGYFPAWLRSAEMNPDIDFFLLFDQEVKSECSNIHVQMTTLEQEVARASCELKEKIEIKDAYKFCDVRPFFGQIYREIVKDYDFWGYCDIDLAFGNIRGFLTDEILSKYERFYDLGHFSLFKNNEKMNHLYDLPGSIYSKQETLGSPVKVFAEEYFGINRICRVNNIPCYTKPDYAEFWTFYPELLLPRGRQNYSNQVFYWENGHAYRGGVNESGEVVTDEYVYIHWQSRKPTPDKNALNNNAYFITTDRLIGKEPGIPDAESILKLAPGMDAASQKRYRRKHVRAKVLEIVKAPWRQKEVWFRQKAMTLIEKKSLFSQSQRTI